MTSPDTIVVADSNIISYIARRIAHRRVLSVLYLAGRQVVISFQTWEETLFGAYLRNWGEGRVANLKRQLEEYQVYWPNPDLVDLCARLRAERRGAGRELGVADAWVAATALYMGCPLVSHDGDFDGIPDLQLIRNPAL